MTSIDEAFPLRSTTGSIGQLPTIKSAHLARTDGPPRKKLRRDAEDESARSVAVLTCPGEGVHLLRTSDQTPLESYSTGPSVHFATPAATRTSKDGITRTHVGVQTADGAELWTWSSVLREGASTTAESTRATTKLSQAISALEAPTELPDRLVIAYADGSIALSDLEGNELARSETSTAASTRISTARSSAAVSQKGAVIGVVRMQESAPTSTRKGKKPAATAPRTSELEILDATSLSSLSKIELPSDMLDVAVDLPSGFVTVLCSDHTLTSYRCTPTGLEAVKSVQLGSPAFLPSVLLSLRNSFVMLVSRFDNVNDALSLTLWDTRFGSVLADQTLPIPASIHQQVSSPNDLAISLARLADESIGLFLGPASGQGRSTAFVVNVSVPATSSLAHVVGRAALTQRYLASSADAQPRLHDPRHNDQQRLMAESMDERRAELLARLDAADAAEGESIVEEYLQSLKEDKIVLPTRFVSRIVRFALPVDESKPAITSIVRRLIEKDALSDAVLPEGVASALLARKNWALLDSALQRVDDIPEQALAQILKAALQLDGSNGLTFTDILARATVYTASPSPLRTALRTELAVTDIAIIFDVLATWLSFWAGINAPADPSGARRTAPPPLEPTLNFAQALLDAHLVSLLQDAAAKESARRLGAAVQQLVRMTDDLAALRAPLAALSVRAKPQKDRTRSTRQVAYELSLNVGAYTLETFNM